MTDHPVDGDVIELRRPPAPRPRVSAAALAATRNSLLDHLQDLGLLEVDQFELAISDLTDLRQRCGQDVVHRQAAANLVAALATLRCGLGFDAVDGILAAAAAENARLRERAVTPRGGPARC